MTVVPGNQLSRYGLLLWYCHDGDILPMYYTQSMWPGIYPLYNSQHGHIWPSYSLTPTLYLLGGTRYESDADSSAVISWLLHFLLPFCFLSYFTSFRKFYGCFYNICRRRLCWTIKCRVLLQLTIGHWWLQAYIGGFMFIGHLLTVTTHQTSHISPEPSDHCPQYV